jgi:hypothetical protein
MAPVLLLLLLLLLLQLQLQIDYEGRAVAASDAPESGCLQSLKTGVALQLRMLVLCLCSSVLEELSKGSMLAVWGG